MKAVIDTNVLVSAILNPRGRPADIINLVLNGEIIVCHDDRIINEYTEVLSRDFFTFNVNDVKALISFIIHYGERIVPVPLAIKLDDPNDLMFYEVLEASQSDFLITGNIKHFKSIRNNKIVTPTEFFNQYFK